MSGFPSSRRSSCLLLGGFPPLEECAHIFWPNLHGGLEFAILLRRNYVAVRVQHGQARHSSVQVYPESGRQVVVVFPFVTNIYMHNNVVPSNQRAEFWRVEGLLQHMAVITPVGAKYREHPLVLSSSCGERC